MSKRPLQPRLFELFPDLPDAPNPEPLPPRKPHAYAAAAEPKAKPSKVFYEIMQPDGDAVVVQSHMLLPILTQRGIRFEIARAVAQDIQQSLAAGRSSYDVGAGLTIRRFEA